MSEELRTEELLTNEGHTETMADYEDHFDDANPWNRVLEYMEKKTILPVKIEGIVNGGAIAMVEGLRGFIPVSKLSLSYIEDLETYLLKDVEVQVIDVDQAGNRLVLSARTLIAEPHIPQLHRRPCGRRVASLPRRKRPTTRRKSRHLVRQPSPPLPHREGSFNLQSRSLFNYGRVGPPQRGGGPRAVH